MLWKVNSLIRLNMDVEILTICKGAALQALDAEKLYRGFQIDEKTNPLLAVNKRVELLRRLGGSLLKLPEIFGANGRPGHLVGKIDWAVVTSNKRGKS